MLEKLVSLPRQFKRLILLCADMALVPISLYCAFMLRFGTGAPFTQVSNSIELFAVMVCASLPVIYFTGLHRIKLVAFEMHDIRNAAFAAISLMAIAIVASYLFRLQGPRSIPLIFGPVFLMSHIGARMIARAFLQQLVRNNGGRIPVAIYGAGSAGVQLLAALRLDPQMRPVTFVDDNLTLQSMTVSGLPVCSRAKLEKRVKSNQVQRILLALPSATEAIRRKRIEELTALGCEVYALPSYSEMMGGTAIADSLRPVTPDMLLGRDKVDLETPEIARTYAGRNIMVTGAGGSIGSELCRQILRCNPSQLILYDHSEFALYAIDRELGRVANQLNVRLSTRLGSVCNRRRLDEILSECSVDIVLHAAAYKHVPLVENNEIEGVRNNVEGTQTTAEAAQAAGVERFILVSTDKAVRPTNIMGATKRLAELVIQDMQTRSDKTKFAMVRFGNVLGSSGSVIPLFQEQIAGGGPITLTHEEITRYFMTIPEAARLVLLAGAYATGGDVFVLDMGKPIYIKDLARRMIKLSGLTVRDTENPNGDIAIETVGLRPGEKLYEELLIGDKTLPTPHEKILRAQESMLSQIEMARILQRLGTSASTGDVAGLRKTISDGVDGYTPESSSFGNPL